MGLSLRLSRNNMQLQTTTTLTKIEELDSARYSPNKKAKKVKMYESQDRGARLPPLVQSSQQSTKATSQAERMPAFKRDPNSTKASAASRNLNQFQDAFQANRGGTPTAVR